MIVTKIRGGLGNQLFTYAAGRALALRYNAPLQLDVSWYQHGKRELLLEHFQIAGQLSPDDHSGAADGVGYNQQSWHYYPEFLQYDGSRFLSGWWQSERFFAEAADQLRRDLTFRDTALLPAARAIRRSLLADRYDSLVAVHCRRGDYVGLARKQQFNLLPERYYHQAMKKFTGRPLFYFFSDDPTWCRATFSGPSIDVCTEPDPIRTLALMQVCDHFVIANSTFSWWAAWLAEQPTTRVIAPPHRLWFGPKLAARYRTEDILPSRWHQLSYLWGPSWLHRFAW